MAEEFVLDKSYTIGGEITDDNFVYFAIDSFGISRGQIDAQYTLIDFMIANGSNIIEYLSARQYDDKDTFLTEVEKEKVVTAMGKYPQAHRMVIKRDFVDSELFGTLQVYDPKRVEHLKAINRRRESIVYFLIYMNVLEIFTDYRRFSFPRLHELLRSIEPELFIQKLSTYSEEGLRFKRIIERHMPRRKNDPEEDEQ
jgi:hypothetical protein